MRSLCKLPNTDEYRIEYKFRFILRNLLAEKKLNTQGKRDRQTDRQIEGMSVRRGKGVKLLYVSRLATSIHTGIVNAIARNNELNLIRVPTRNKTD